VEAEHRCASSAVVSDRQDDLASFAHMDTSRPNRAADLQAQRGEGRETHGRRDQHEKNDTDEEQLDEAEDPTGEDGRGARGREAPA
jgi:hypothetical protein